MPVVKRLQRIGRASRVIIVGPPMLLELGWQPDETIAMEVVGNVLLVQASAAATAPDTPALEAGIKRLGNLLKPKDGALLTSTKQQLLSALRDDGPATALQLGRRLGITTHHTKRVLRAMNRSGYLSWDDEGRFVFLPEAFHS